MWKLNKALYGYRKTPKLWHQHLVNVLESLNYHPLLTDPSCFRNDKTNTNIFVRKPGCTDARQTRKHCMHVKNTLWAAEDLTNETVLSTVGERACCDARPSRIRLTHRKSESHGIVRRLPEMASSWRVRVAPPRSEQWRERVAPPELMGGSSRTVLTSKQTSQILGQNGTGAEARATSGSSAICETCEGKQIECGKT